MALSGRLRKRCRIAAESFTICCSEAAEAVVSRTALKQRIASRCFMRREEVISDLRRIRARFGKRHVFSGE
jgi:hypothetical protein